MVFFYCERCDEPLDEHNLCENEECSLFDMCETERERIQQGDHKVHIFDSEAWNQVQVPKDPGQAAFYMLTKMLIEPNSKDDHNGNWIVSKFWMQEFINRCLKINKDMSGGEIGSNHALEKLALEYLEFNNMDLSDVDTRIY